MFYTYEHYENKTLIVQLELDVVGELDMTSGDPEIDIEQLRTGGQDLLTSNSAFTKMIAETAKEVIAADTDWLRVFAHSEGWRFAQDYGDPDGEWRVSA